MDNLSLYSKSKLKLTLPVWAKQEEIPQDKKIILVSPHSDDISISLGGFAFELAKRNQVLPLLFFSGFRGVLNKSKEEAREIRQGEMKKEAKALGLLAPVLLDLASYENLKQAFKKDVLNIQAVFLKEKPDFIFLPKKDDSHPSHQLAVQLTLNALSSLKVKPFLFFYENPWSLFRADEINTIFLIEKQALKAKKKAILCHKSQLKRTDFLTVALALSKFRALTLPEQRVFGFGKGSKGLKLNHIETFKRDENINL
ncbi:MAG: PIG-L family deacetylase [bacterium]|nr:PIG-L family deacetylase [bacterium]